MPIRTVDLITGNGLGISYSSYTQVGSLLPTKPLGQMGIKTFYNITNNNFVAIDRPISVDEQNGRFNLGFIYNSGVPSDDKVWRLNIKKFQKMPNWPQEQPDTLTLEEEDGHVTTYKRAFNLNANIYVAESHGNGTSYIYFNTNTNQWDWYHPGTETCESYDSDGFLVTRKDKRNNKTSFSQKNGKYNSVTCPSGDTYNIEYSAQEIVISKTPYDSQENVLLRKYTLNTANPNLIDTVYYCHGETIDGSVEYSYGDKTNPDPHQLESITDSNNIKLQLEFTLVDHNKVALTHYLLGDNSHKTDLEYTANTVTCVTPFSRSIITFNSDNKVTEVRDRQIPNLDSDEKKPSEEVYGFTYNADKQIEKINLPNGGFDVSLYKDNKLKLRTTRQTPTTTYRTYYDTANDLTPAILSTSIDEYKLTDEKLESKKSVEKPKTELVTHQVYDVNFDGQGGRAVRFTISPRGQVTEHRLNLAGLIRSSIVYDGALFDVDNLPSGSTVALQTMLDWLTANMNKLTVVGFNSQGYNSHGQIDVINQYDHIDAKTGEPNIKDATRSEVIQAWTAEGGLMNHSVRISGDNKRADTINKLDGLSRITESTDPLKQIQSTIYQANQITATHSDQSQQQIKLDQFGLVALKQLTGSYKDKAIVRTSQYLRDIDGRIVKATKPDSFNLYKFHDYQDRELGQLSALGILSLSEYHTQNRYKKTINFVNRIDISKVINPEKKYVYYDKLISYIQHNHVRDPKDCESYEFYDTQGRVRFAVDGDGFVIEKVYNFAGKLTNTIHYAKAITTDLLNALKAGQDVSLAPIASEKDRATQSYYDKDSRHIGEKDEEGYITEYKLDGDNNIIEKIQYEKPNKKFNRNDTLDMVRPAIGNDAHTYYFNNAKGQAYLSIDALGYITKNEYHVDGKLKKQTRFATKVDPSWYQNKSVEPVIVTDREDRFSIHEYDDLDREITVTHSFGKKILKSYNKSNDLIEEHHIDTADMKSTDGDKYRASLKRYDNTGLLRAEANNYIAKLLTDVDNDPEYKNDEERAAAKEKIWETKSIRHEYEPSGLRICTRNTLNEPTLFYYDQDRRPVYSIDPTGIVIEEVKDSFNHVTQRTIYATRLSADILAKLTGGFATAEVVNIISQLKNLDKDMTTLYENFDNRGNACKITDPEKNVTLREYSAFGELQKETLQIDSQNNLVVDHEYNNRGQEITTTQTDKDKNILRHRREYNHFTGKQTADINANDDSESYGIDLLGRTESVTTAEDNTSKKQFDAFNRTVTEIDAQERATNHSYNQTTREHTVAPAEADTTYTEVDNIFNEKISHRDALNNTSSWQREADGSIHQFTDALKQKKTTDHDTEGKKTRVISKRDIKSEFGYNNSGQLDTIIQDTDNLNLTTTLQPNVLNKSELDKEPNGNKKKKDYDRNGKLVTLIKDPSDEKYQGLDRKTKMGYNSQSTLASITEGDEKVQYQKTLQVDNYNRGTGSTVDPNGLNIQTKKQLDNTGKTIVDFDANQNPTFTFYDKDGRKRFSINAMGEIHEWVYTKTNKVACDRIYHNRIDISLINANQKLPDLIKLISDQNVQSNLDVERYYFYDKIDRERFTIDMLKSDSPDLWQGVVKESNYKGINKPYKKTHYSTFINTAQIATFNTENLTQLMLNQANPLDDRSTYSIYDELQRERFIIDPMGVVSEQRFNADGKVTAKIMYANPVTDPAALINLSPNDVLAHITVDPHNDRANYSILDNLNRVQYGIDPEGAVVYYKYDGDSTRITLECRFAQPAPMNMDISILETLVQTWVPNKETDSITVNEYNNDGTLNITINPLEFKDGYGYNAVSNQIYHSDRNNQLWLKQYDAAKRLQKETTPPRNVTTINQADNNQLTSTTDCLAVEKKLDSDNNGNTSQITEGSNTQTPRTIISKVDKANRPCGTIVKNVKIDDPSKAADFTNRPETSGVDIETTILYNTRNQKIAEKLENGFWRFYVRDSLENIRYRLDPISKTSVAAAECKYKVTYCKPNTYGETTQETKLDESLVLDAEQFANAQQSGISLSWLQSQVDLNALKNRSTYKQYNRQAMVTEQTKDECFYLRVTPDRRFVTGKAKPTIQFKYNAFKETISQLENQAPDENGLPVWSQNRTWHNRKGKALVEARSVKKINNQNAHTYIVKQHGFDVFQNETSSTEYATNIPIPDKETTLPEVASILAANTNIKDRKYRRAFDLCNQNILQERVDVPVYEQQNDPTTGLPVLVFVGTATYKIAKDYTPTGKCYCTTLENGQKKFTFFDECGFKVAETGVSRKSYDERLGEVKITPLTKFNNDAFGKAVETTRYATSIDPVTDPKLIPTCQASDKDQNEKILNDNRGLPTVRQDANKNIFGKSYTATKKEAREWYFLTNHDAIILKDSSNKETASFEDKKHIDEKRTTFDASDRKTYTEMRRDNAVEQNSRKKFKINNFNEVEAECYAQKCDSDTPSLLREHDKNGNCWKDWKANKNNGITSINLFDLARNESGQIQTRRTDTLLPKMPYSGLSDLVNSTSNDNTLELSLTMRDLQSRLTGKISSSVEVGAILTAIPLQIQAQSVDSTHTTAQIKWNLPHATTVVASDISLIPFPTEDKKEGYAANITYNGALCSVDVSDLPADDYEYTIYYYPRNNQGQPDKSLPPLYVSKGRLQVDTGLYDKSENLVLIQQGAQFKLVGNSNGVTEMELKLDGKETGIRLPVNNGMIDLQDQVSGHYSFIPYRSNQALRETPAYTVKTAHYSQEIVVPVSQQYDCQAILSLAKNRLSLTAPRDLQGKSIHFKCEFKNAAGGKEIIEKNIDADEKGNYDISFNSVVSSITSMSIDVLLSDGETIPIYRNEGPSLKAQAKHIAIREKIAKDLDDWDGVTSDEEEVVFAPKNILYITQMPLLIKPATINFTDVSEDCHATNKKLAVTGDTIHGITLDVSGMAPGNYPFVIPSAPSQTSCFTISNGLPVFSGNITSVVPEPRPLFRAFDWDPWNNMLEMIDALNKKTSYEYSDLNKLLKKVRPMIKAYVAKLKQIIDVAPTTLSAFNEVGDQLSKMNENGYAQQYEVNEAGQRLKTTLEDGALSKQSAINALGQEIAHADGRVNSDGSRNIWQQGYNGTSQPTCQVSPLKKETNWAYNELQAPVSENLPNQNPTLYGHDVMKNINVVDEADRKNYDVYTHGLNGDIRTQLNSIDGRQSWETDDFGAMNSHTNLSGQTTQYQPNGKGEVTKQTCNNGGGTYLELVREIRMLSFATETIAEVFSTAEHKVLNQDLDFEYNNSRLMKIIDNATNMVVCFSYDEKERRTGMTISTKNPSTLLRKVVSQYDDDDNETVVFDTYATITFTIDPVSNHTRIDSSFTDPSNGETTTSTLLNEFSPANHVTDSRTADNKNTYQAGYKDGYLAREVNNGEPSNIVTNADGLVTETKDDNNNPLTTASYDDQNKPTGFIDYKKNIIVGDEYHPNTSNLKRQTQSQLDGKHNVDTTFDDNYTSNHIPRHQTSKYTNNPAKIKDDLWTDTINIDVPMESSVTGERTDIYGNDTTVTPAVNLYDSNSKINAIRGTDTGDEKTEAGFIPKDTVYQNTPHGEPLSSITIKQPVGGTVALKATQQVFLTNASGSPISTYQVTLGYDALKFALIPPALGRSYCSTTKGGAAFTLRQSPLEQLFRRQTANVPLDVMGKALQIFKSNNSLKILTPTQSLAANFPGPAPSEYVAGDNDKNYDDIAMHAQRAGMGEKIKNANDNKPISAGVRFTIPQMVTTTNKAGEFVNLTDFRNQIYAALLPHLTTPLPDDHDEFFSQLVEMAAIAIAIAAAPGLTSFLFPAITAGAAGSMTLSYAIAEGLSAGLINASIQGVATATGIENHFVINDVFEVVATAFFNPSLPASVTSAATATATTTTAATTGGTSISEIAINAAKASAASQLIEMSIGTRNKFDPRAVATAYLSQYAIGQINNVYLSQYNLPAPLQIAINTTLSTAISSIIYRQNINFESLAANILGTELGNEIGSYNDQKLALANKSQTQQADSVHDTAKKSAPSYKADERFARELEKAEATANMALPDINLDETDPNLGSYIYEMGRASTDAHIQQMLSKAQATANMPLPDTKINVNDPKWTQKLINLGSNSHYTNPIFLGVSNAELRSATNALRTTANDIQQSIKDNMTIDNFNAAAKFAAEQAFWTATGVGLIRLARPAYGLFRAAKIGLNAEFDAIKLSEGTAKLGSITSTNISSELDPFIVRQMGAEIAKNPVAARSYIQLKKIGTDIQLDFSSGHEELGISYGRSNEIEIYMQNNPNVKEAVSTLVHESSHIQRYSRGFTEATQYEEYLAFRREFLYKNNGARPTLLQRQAIWENVQELYPHLPVHKVPVAGW